MSNIEDIKINELVENPAENVKDFEEKTQEKKPITIRDVVKEVVFEMYNDVYYENKKVYLDGNTPLTSEYNTIIAKCGKRGFTLTNRDCKTILVDLAKSENDRKKREKEEILAEKRINSWDNQLERDNNGNCIHTLTNLTKLLINYPNYKEKISFNEFTNDIDFCGELYDKYHNGIISLLCESVFKDFKKDWIDTSVTIVAKERKYHPIKSKLEDLIWDGEERMDEFFIKNIGVDDTQLNRIMTRNWFYALMKRLYEPGCPFDNILIVCDQTQGTGKSKIIWRLLKSIDCESTYNTTVQPNCSDKDSADKMLKSWVVGFDEMAKLVRKDSDEVKEFLQNTHDLARLSYEKRSKSYARHCIFYGNTNVENFLKDYSSDFERRYWIMEANGKPHDEYWWDENCPYEYCKQVLAEALYFYQHNLDYKFSTLNTKYVEELKKVQERHKTSNSDDILCDKLFETLLSKKYHTIEFKDYSSFANVEGVNYNPNEDVIEGFTDIDKNLQYLNKIPTKWIKRYLEEKLYTKRTTQYITSLMKKLGYEYKPAKYNGKTNNCYVLTDVDVLESNY